MPGTRNARPAGRSRRYGIEGQAWLVWFHTFTRYLDIREGDTLDEVQLAEWARQAAALPGGTA